MEAETRGRASGAKEELTQAAQEQKEHLEAFPSAKIRSQHEKKGRTKKHKQQLLKHVFILQGMRRKLQKYGKAMSDAIGTHTTKQAEFKVQHKQRVEEGRKCRELLRRHGRHALVPVYRLQSQLKIADCKLNMQFEHRALEVIRDRLNQVALLLSTSMMSLTAINQAQQLLKVSFSNHITLRNAYS